MEYEIAYVDYDTLQRNIDTRGWTLDEGDVLAACQKGDNWVRSAMEKHGADTHSAEVLTHYATQWAWLQIIIFKIGDRYRDAEEPLFMSTIREECKMWFNGGVATYNRPKISSMNITRGVSGS